jgi:PKD repeat protein/photosystem II stability/assembly factor-like uncharacterized protein
MEKFSRLLVFLLAGTVAYAQNGDWVEQMNDPSVNFYTVQQNFENYWKERTVEKGKGWKQFKRWENFTETRVYPDGERPSALVLGQAFQQTQPDAAASYGQWKPLGPFNGNTIDGIGRINRIAFDPTNPQVIWMGAPAGGLWKSVDAGQNWTTNTDQLANLGISDIEIDPSNTSIMYLATGDRDGGDTYSFGVLKSTDGGNTWNGTGLVHAVTSQVKITDLYLNPDNTNIIVATTSQGIYRSADAGNTWTSVQSGSFNAIVQKPGNPNILFCSSLSSPRIYKSNNNGQSWGVVSHSALPTGGIRRIELAVTPHDSNYIYALYGESTNNGFLAICRSTDGGDTWAQMANSPNLLGWQVSGNDVGGQAWYDLALAVNPTNKNELYVGGVNIWRSNNGGSNWSIATHWYGGGGNPFVHADIHHLIYHPVTGQIHAGTDGGLYRKKLTQNAWDELNNGLNITQYYKMGTSASDTTRIIAGAQDNGTHLNRSTGWIDVYGGDGMDCAISSKNPNVMYASIYYGDFFKSTNGGNSFRASFNLPPAGNGNWVTPFMLDPQHPDTIYAGFGNVWRSFDGGLNFTDLTASSISGSGNIDVLGIAPKNTNHVFMANGNRLYKSTDYGNSWVRLSSLSVSRAITGIAVGHDNPDHIVVTISGYTANQKVYESKDGGATWSNLSNGLPNLPVNCAVIEDNADHSIYIGTDVGVYYRDDNHTEWLSFKGNLPNVIVNELEINYLNRKLRAATYGRGVWESPLYSDLVPPIANMKLSQSICLNDTVTLFDNSEYSPSTYKWSITPATYTFVKGTADTSKNPIVVFSQKGFYDIALKVENLLGSDSVLQIGAIAVGGYPLPFYEGFNSIADFSKWGTSDVNANGWERMVSYAGDYIIKASLYNNPTISNYDLISPAVDFSGHDSVWLNFDHAYNGQPANFGDSLLVYAAAGCSDNWVLIQSYGENGSNNFRTAGSSNTAFSPLASEWCGASGFATCNTINLSAFAGMEGVRIRFVAVNNGGNHLYLDNVKLEGNPIVSPSPNFASLKNACALDTVSFADQTYGSPQNWDWSFDGPDSFNSQDRNPTVAFTKAGTYSVKLKVSNSNGADSVTKASYITIDAADSVKINLNYTGAFICASDTFKLTANTTNAGTKPAYSWYLNGTLQGSSNGPSFNFVNLSPGDQIYASLRSDLECAFPELVVSDTISVNVFPTTAIQINPVGTLCSTGNAVALSASPSGGTFSGPGVSGNSFDPKVTGNGSFAVYYTFQDANSCLNTQSINITVQAPPAINMINTPSFCDGDAPKQLVLATPLGGVYAGPGITNNQLNPSVAGAGVHAVTYTYTSSNCGAVSQTFNITISKTDTPEVYVGNNELVCSITATQYQWFDENNKAIPGANSKTYIPSTNGRYRVAVINSNNCYGQSELVDFNISLDELPSGAEFKVFPNPTRQNLTVEISGMASLGQMEMRLYNSVGSAVKAEIFEMTGTYEKTFDVSGLAHGVYTLTLTGKDIHVTRKVVIGE